MSAQRWLHTITCGMSQTTLGNLTIDRGRVAVWVAGKRVPLTYVEFELLCQLARRAGEVVSRQKLMKAVWHEPAFTSDRKLTVHICRVRTKLSGSDPWRIETFTRRGYGLIDSADVSSGNGLGQTEEEGVSP